MTHTRKRGSAVGLMMVHNIVQAREGTAHVIGIDGKTSSFIFAFLRIGNIEMPKSIPMRVAQLG
jgi:signal transduction histidine kinase